MEDGLDFLMAPVEAGYFTFDKLLDGSLDLADVADCNDHILFAAENRARARKAADQK